MTAEARRRWQRKLDHLLAQEPVVSSAAQRFELSEQIAECRAKLAYLDEEDRRRAASGPAAVLAEAVVGAERLLDGGPALDALLAAVKKEGLLLRAVPVDAAGTTHALAVATADATPLPAAVLVDALSQQIAKALARIRERYLRGERVAATAELYGLLEHPAWPHLAISLRGRLLRTAALYRLSFDQDQAEAATLAERAATEDPEGDGQALAAHLALDRGDRKAALSILEIPRSLQARHLKAAILIEDGKREAALEILAAPTEPSAESASETAPQADLTDAAGNTAETWRLRALAYLALKRLPDAVAAIDAARTLAPDWIGVRSAVAMIDFWRICTPAALALTEQPLWPMPFRRGLVRADAGARLAEIELTFATVADAMPASSDEQGQWLTWRLVALLAAGDRLDAATELAKRLIDDADPLHIWPLLWARFFELDIDRVRLKERLKNVSAEDPNFIPLTGLCLELRLNNGEVEGVLADIDAITPTVTALGYPEVPRQWRMLALTADGKLEQAGAIVDTVADERLRLRMRLHIARGQEADTPGSHKAAAAALFAIDQGLDVLAETCEVHAQAGDWAFVAAHADALLEGIPTPGSLRLLAIAAFNRGDYRRCIRALDEHRHVFPDGRLPDDLALLRVRCQRELGEPSQAVRDARALFDEAQTAERLVELLNAQIAAANTPGMLDALRRLTLIEPANGHLLLQGARVAVQLDRELAIALWRRAATQGQSGAQFVIQAATLGELLGLGAEETAPWFQRMAELAESGNGIVQKLHISEIPQLMREHGEAVNQWLDKLWRGEIAAHLLTSGLPGLLPATLHADPEHNRGDPDPLEQRPILIRHGARPLGFSKPRLEPRPRLILDLTALMTAQSMGLLEKVEQAFGPLWLHRHWHQLLRTEAERLMRSQPRHSAAHAQIGDLIRCDGIALVDLDVLARPDESVSALVSDLVARELEWARASGGCLLTYLPLHGADIERWPEVHLPSPWSEVLLGPRALLDGLLAEGRIDRERHEQGSAAFPPEPETRYLRTLPTLGSVLLSNTVMLGQFAELGLLTALSHRFRLRLCAQDWNRDEQQEAARRRRVELADWIGKLIERVAAGRQAELYRLLPAHGSEPDGGEPKHNGLDDLLAYPGELGDLLWVDDRFINGFPRTGRTTIVGVVEILDLLQKAGAIDKAERFELLHRLRASNYRFVPLDSNEIQHWLRQAHSPSDRLIVPAQLDVLARYWSACLYQGEALQWSGNRRHGQGELPFFVASQSTVAKVLRAIWSDDRLDLNRRRQRADWVLDNLYVGIGDIPHLGPQPTRERDTNLVGMDQASLCFGAFDVMLKRIGRDRKEAKQDRMFLECARERSLAAAAEYLSWICERVVGPRLLADPWSAGPTAAAFRGLLLGSFAREDNDMLPSIGSWLLHFLPVLPPVLRDELHKDQDLMQRLGLEQVTYLKIGDLHFRVQDFWPAVQMALRGASPSLQDTDGGEPFSLRLVSERDAPRPMLELADRSGSSVGRGYYQFSELLLDARDRRLQALRANPHWWDGDSRCVEAIERDLAMIDSAALRVREVRRIVARSADAHYLELEEELHRSKRVRLGRCFPPPLSAILTYVRCTEASADGESLAGQCWEALVQSVPAARGLAESLRRISLLPCPLPVAVHRAIAALDIEARRELLKLAPGRMTHAVGRLHLIDLLLASAATLPEALGLAQEQIGYLSSLHFAHELKLTLALVDLAYRAFGAEAEENGIDARQQLLAAWAHAGVVTDIMRWAGIDLDDLATRLKQWAPFPHRDLYAKGRGPMLDLAWPWHVEAVDLVFAGLGRILSRYADLVPRLDLSALQARLARLDAGVPETARDVYLLRDTGLLADSLGCLWGGDRSVSLAPLIGSDKASRFAPYAFAGLVDGWLSELSAEPQRAQHWHSLYVTVLHGTLPCATAERLDAILSRVDIDALSASDRVLPIAAMDLAVRHRSDRDAVIAQIYRWAQDFDSGVQATAAVSEQPGLEASQQFGERLIHWLHVLAARHPEDPDGEFARLLDGLILRSRALAMQLRDPLLNIARHLPYSRHRALRRTLLAARARPAPPVGEAATGGSVR